MSSYPTRLILSFAVSLALTACGGTDKKLVEGNDVQEDGAGLDMAQEDGADCLQACLGLECGIVDGCECGACANGETCTDKGKCEKEGPTCESICEAFAIECGPFNDCECGDCAVGFACSAEGACEPDPCLEPCEGRECGEVDGCTCGTCAEEEDCSEDGQCFVVVPPCETECEDVECGTVDGCECGDCDEGMACVAHKCVDDTDPCVPVCENKECGDFKAPDDGDCQCGDCAQGFVCTDEGTCVEEPDVCVVLCADLDCGTIDDCDCGTCLESEKCENNQCVPDVVDNCVATCGDAECGEVGDCNCGTCTFGQCLNGGCSCLPNCDETDCGPDGCGGSCGVCSGNQVCAWDGKCHAECNPAAIPFSDTVQKVVSLVFGNGGYPGEALDVDNDASTCSPAGQCSSGMDNQLSGLFSQIEMFVDVNATMMEAVEDGSLCMLAEFLNPKFNGTPFTINMFMSEPAVPKNQCNFQTQTCNYLVFPEGVDGESCKPVMWFDNAIVAGDKLHAGGPQYKFSMMLAFFPGAPLIVTLQMAQLTGIIEQTADGTMSIEQGVIGGAIPKEKLLTAVDNLPDDIGLPISKDMIKNLLNLFITNDMDTDGDGLKESASVGMKFNSLTGHISGVVF